MPHLRHHTTAGDEAQTHSRRSLVGAIGEVSTTTAARTTIFTWLGFVDLQFASEPFGTVQLRNCQVFFRFVLHFNEGKPSLSACLTVCRKANPADLTIF